ncbi:hypothetical protein SAMN06295909_0119 [Plantibacter sp. VKM Ac-1784]|uniref:Uncharacterized protein n=1 Tax=Plantibacter elymi (nom. nud.) TaxID=199708 RepID=A0ABY1R9L7_9MICO|nr:hypothetical protein [Plantibacter sp. VKM Ac-1784]SMQ58188.1 hypothetical protein SAMN06295909_0119 [Plantibacter sp. VKM Ac-1784]
MTGADNGKHNNVRQTAAQAARVFMVLNAARIGKVPTAVLEAAAAYEDAVYQEAVLGGSALTKATDELWDAFDALDFSALDLGRE